MRSLDKLWMGRELEEDRLLWVTLVALSVRPLRPMSDNQGSGRPGATWLRREFDEEVSVCPLRPTCKIRSCGVFTGRSGEATRDRGLGSLRVAVVCDLFCADDDVSHLWREPAWLKLGLVVDSGAAESVAPRDMSPWVTTRESSGSKRGERCLSACGDKSPNFGE